MNSMSVLNSFLSFQIQVLTFSQEILAWLYLFSRLVYWTTRQWMPITQLCGHLTQDVWIQASLGVMCPLVQADSQNLSCEEMLFVQLPAPFIHRAGMWHRIEFFPWRIEFQLSSSFSKAVQCVVFTRVLLSHPTQTCTNSDQHSAPPISGRREKSLQFLATSFVQGGVNCQLALLESVVPSKGDVSCSPGGDGDSVGWKQVSFKSA